MKQISRLSIQRMIDTSGSAGSGGSGGNDISLAGYATEAWVEENYLSKEFFLRLFGIHGTDENDDPVDVEPNDPDTTITDIEAMFGFWTEKYISALGQGSGGGGGGGGSDTRAGLIDVELTNPAAGQVLKYNGTKWVNSAASAGTVTSVGMSVPTGFTVTGSPITVSGVLGLSFAAGYSLPTTAKQTNWDAAYTWTSVSRTTLADYGITDAKFGTPGTDSIPITLGPTTQSVLTQHQSLANYYTKSETDGKFLTISFFRSLFKAYNSSDVEVQPNDGNTATITNIKAMFGFWTEQYISALGQSSGGGGGVTLNQPLLGINQAGLSAPSSAGLGLVFNGSAWVYTNAASMSVYGLTVSSTLQAYKAIFGSTVSGAAFSATGGGFSVSGKDNTYVLLAGGGTKLLSEIGGGGAVNSITLGQGGTNYTPDASGIITLPPYPSKTSQLTNDSGFITGYTDTKNTAGATDLPSVKLYLIGANGQTANPQTYTNSGCYIDANGYLFSGGVKVLTDAVKSVVIGAGGTPISPVNGVVMLPAYPSKTSQLTNDSGFITGYTDTKNTAGSTNKVNTKMYFVAAESQAANPTTYSNSSCYIGTDNCLYSGGTKVLTSHQSLVGYATETWVQQQGYTTVNSRSVITIGGLNIVTGSGVTGGANIAGRVGIGGDANSSYYLLVYGTTRLHNMELGEETTISTVTCAMIKTRSSRGIYINTGTAPNYVDGTWSNASDIRLKDIVSKIGGSVDDIANAPIFNFRWKAGGNQVMVGTSAQYWQNVLPNTVTQAFNGYLYMDYSAAAIAAAVITARKVQDHEGRLQILERENEALRREIQILKSA